MTRNYMDFSVHVFSRRAVRLLVVMLACIGAMSAHAQVNLTNSVMKVISTVNSEGVVERQLVNADGVIPGDELRYTIAFENVGKDVVDAGSIVITNPIPENTEYLEGTAFGAGTDIVYSLDGETFAAPAELTVVEDGIEVTATAASYKAIRWTFSPQLQPGEKGSVSFNVRLK